ncbi:MAG TPA: hypothetical protein VLC93_09140 [Myxococcota bacterium]|nr:hypothetical protein [Myxococcota bacterium]
MSVGIWSAFWLCGLPDYYQQYTFTWLAIASALILPPVVWAGARVLSRSRPERRLGKSLWLAFYMTAPFFLLDAWYCGLYLGHGTAYLSRYWYLTIYYVIPWFVFVPTAWHFNRRETPQGVS